MRISLPGWHHLILFLTSEFDRILWGYQLLLCRLLNQAFQNATHLSRFLFLLLKLLLVCSFDLSFFLISLLLFLLLLLLLQTFLFLPIVVCLTLELLLDEGVFNDAVNFLHSGLLEGVVPVGFVVGVNLSPLALELEEFLLCFKTLLSLVFFTLFLSSFDYRLKVVTVLDLNRSHISVFTRVW
jgi:hypothetical protein